MGVFVALLRAVNVGGTGKLAMRDLAALCEAAGFSAVRTYIASGNVIFASCLAEAEVKQTLESALEKFAGKRVGLLVRSAGEMAEVAANNPFNSAPGNRVVAIFLDHPVTPAILAAAAGVGADEEITAGRREIYVRYGTGMANSKLRIPAASSGTARNMNTVAKLAAMAGAQGE